MRPSIGPPGGWVGCPCRSSPGRGHTVGYRPRLPPFCPLLRRATRPVWAGRIGQGPIWAPSSRRLRRNPSPRGRPNRSPPSCTYRSLTQGVGCGTHGQADQGGARGGELTSEIEAFDHVLVVTGKLGIDPPQVSQSEVNAVPQNFSGSIARCAHGGLLRSVRVGHQVYRPEHLRRYHTHRVRCTGNAVPKSRPSTPAGPADR